MRFTRATRAYRLIGMQLSKSEYMMYLKHPAWVWYKKHDKAKLPEIDAATQAMFDAGAAFEAYAEQRFENGHKLGFDNYQEYLDLPDRTRAVLAGDTDILLQGRFVGDHITCICDGVVKVDQETLDIYEIKSSTKVKDEHISDLGFQLVVLEQAGWRVRNVHIIHVDTAYTRQGDIDPFGISLSVDVTDRVKETRTSTRHAIDEAWKVLQQSEPPDISPRHASATGFNDWLEIFKHIHGGIDDASIYNLFLADSKLIGQLEDAHVETIADIPEYIDLGKKQRWHVAAVKTGKQHIDPNQITQFISGLAYPVHFLDYETAGGVVPPFNGMRPYEQLPFQYSLHILHSPGGEPEHYEYLHTQPTDPVPDLLQRLEEDVESTGTVLVWNERFERRCNELMGRIHPEYAAFLEDINARLEDLMLPFSSGWFIDERFGGSASLKRVLPVLAPELSYQELDIQDGGNAQRSWMHAILEDAANETSETLFEQLRHYCGLDTLAMVHIFHRLYKLESVSSPNEDHRDRKEQLRFL